MRLRHAILGRYLQHRLARFQTDRTRDA
jgi:hypothetical protein